MSPAREARRFTLTEGLHRLRALGLAAFGARAFCRRAAPIWTVSGGGADLSYDAQLSESDFAKFAPNGEVLRYIELTRQRLLAWSGLPP